MADDETRKMKVTWPAWMSKRKKGHLSTSDFSASLDHIVQELLLKAVLAATGTEDLAKAETAGTAIRKRHRDLFDKLDNNLKAPYNAVHEAYTEFSNERQQQDWATTRDHRKFLVYRTLQAILIGAVILGTSYVAQRLGITLPIGRFIAQ